MMGVLAVSAALAMTAASCSSDDDVMETPPAPPTGKVHVTVGAGIGEGTRSAVVKDGATRTLKFTEGDQLFIAGDIERNKIRMGGVLQLVSVSDDGCSATFSGDLSFVENKGNWNWQEKTDYVVQHPEDPIQDYYNAPTCYLIHKDTPAELFSFSSDLSIDYNQKYSLAADASDAVGKLMTSVMYVYGCYEANINTFKLDVAYYPIFNCTITGLKANTKYVVGFVVADDENDYSPNSSSADISAYIPTVTTDDGGTATFAISHLVFGSGYRAIWFREGDNGEIDWSSRQYEVILGTRQSSSGLHGKVFTVNKAAVTVEYGDPSEGW